MGSTVNRTPVTSAGPSSTPVGKGAPSIEGNSSVYVPLTADEVQAKLEHLEGNFASQQSKPWYDREALQALIRLRGVECHAPEGYAEAFHADRIVIR